MGQFSLYDTKGRGMEHVVRNLVHLHGSADPKALEEGRVWYPKVHDAVAKHVRGTSTSEKGGAGLVSAVSAGMDFDKGHIGVLDELHSFSSSDWKTLQHSYSQPRVEAINKNGQRLTSPAKRTPEASAVLNGKYVGRTTDGNLQKAHRILQGEDPSEVLGNAPKYMAFMHNIHEPDKDGPVTIDGRAHDLGVNEMRPWQVGRGLTGSRYAHFEQAHRTARDMVAPDEPAHTIQAQLWVHGKNIEKAMPGAKKDKGPTRSGQGYF